MSSRSQELLQIRDECRALVRQRALISAGAAVVPVPFLDMVVDAGILMELIPEVSRRFGLAPEHIEAMPEAQRGITWKLIRERGSQLIGIVVTRQLARSTFQLYARRLLAAQLAKFVPLGGQLLAAGLGYFVMRKIAYQHVEDCYTVAYKSRLHAAGN
jgi:uncharacterized protein (DUF697 family)